MKMPEYDNLGNITNTRVRELDRISKEDIMCSKTLLNKLNKQYKSFERELRMDEC